MKEAKPMKGIMKKPAIATPVHPHDVVPKGPKPGAIDALQNGETEAADDMQVVRDRIKSRKFMSIFDSLPEFVRNEFKKAPTYTRTYVISLNHQSCLRVFTQQEYITHRSTQCFYILCYRLFFTSSTLLGHEC
jgi:hypothetical protein